MDHCKPYSFDRLYETYKNSSVPVFFLPGDNEWNDCDDFQGAADKWRSNFVGFEQNWSPLPFEVFRQRNRIENFYFVYKRVIYIGLNMVGGQVHDEKEWSIRLNDNIRWVRNRVRDHIEEIELVMIFGNSGNTDVNRSFFVDLASLVSEWNSEYIQDANSRGQIRRSLPVLYVKESENESVLHKNFMGKRDFVLVNIQSGIWPAAKISVDAELNEITYNNEKWM